jgi:YVTN family beta-propeller protein
MHTNWLNHRYLCSARVVGAVMVAAVVFLMGVVQPTAAHDDLVYHVFVPNRASADIGVIDSRTDTVVARIPVGRVPHQVVVSDTLRKLVASNTEDNTISIVDLNTRKMLTTLPLDKEPEHMEISPMDDVVAVGNIGAGSVSLISLADHKERHRITGFFEPHNLTWSPDGSLLYVANLGANHVSVVNVSQGKIVNEIPVAEPQAVAKKTGTSASEFQGIINVTRTPDGRFGFAAHGESGKMAVIDLRTVKTQKSLNVGTMPWRAFTTANGQYMLVPNNGDETVAVIDTMTQEIVKVLPGAPDMTGVNTGWFDTTAFVISRGADKVLILDLIAMQKVGEISLKSSPETGVITPDGTKLYVALSGSDRVAVIDTQQRKLLTMIEGVGKEPWGAHMVGAVNYCH